MSTASTHFFLKTLMGPLHTQIIRRAGTSKCCMITLDGKSLCWFGLCNSWTRVTCILVFFWLFIIVNFFFNKTMILGVSLDHLRVLQFKCLSGLYNFLFILVSGLYNFLFILVSGLYNFLFILVSGLYNFRIEKLFCGSLCPICIFSFFRRNRVASTKDVWQGKSFQKCTHL